MVSCDPNDGMQVLHQKGHRGELAEVVPADRNCGKMLVVQHRSRYNKNYATQYEFVYRECRAVAYRLMHNWKDNPGLKTKHKNALKEGLRQMNGRLRAHKRENGRGVLSTALLAGYMAYVSSGGKYAVQAPPEEDFIEHCARRSAEICLRFFLTSQPKQFPIRSTKYYAVVIMYLLKVGPGARFPGAPGGPFPLRFSFGPTPSRPPRALAWGRGADARRLPRRAGDQAAGHAARPRGPRPVRPRKKQVYGSP